MQRCSMTSAIFNVEDKCLQIDMHNSYGYMHLHLAVDRQLRSGVLQTKDKGM